MPTIPQDSDPTQVPKNLLQFPVDWSKIPEPTRMTLAGRKFQEESLHTVYIYQIAYELAIAKVDKELTKEILTLWVTSKVVKKEIQRMVKFAYSELYHREKDNPYSKLPNLSKLTESSSKLLTIMFQNLQLNGEYIPFCISIQQMCKATDLSRNTIKRCLVELEKHKFISIERGGPRSGISSRLGGENSTWIQIIEPTS